MRASAVNATPRKRDLGLQAHAKASYDAWVLDPTTRGAAVPTRTDTNRHHGLLTSGLGCFVVAPPIVDTTSHAHTILDAQRIGFDPPCGSMADKPRWTEPLDSEHESLEFVINAVVRRGSLGRILKHSRAYIDVIGDPGAGSGR
jgi:hypothetical protein